MSVSALVLPLGYLMARDRCLDHLLRIAGVGCFPRHHAGRRCLSDMSLETAVIDPVRPSRLHARRRGWSGPVRLRGHLLFFLVSPRVRPRWRGLFAGSRSARVRPVPAVSQCCLGACAPTLSRQGGTSLLPSEARDDTHWVHAHRPSCPSPRPFRGCMVMTLFA